jgi:hypothetical protein
MAGIRIQGVNELQRFFLGLVPKTKQGIKQVTEATGRQTAHDTQVRVRVDTGKGRQSVYFTSTKGGFGAEIGFGEAYMWYHEFGTGGAIDIPAGFEDLASPLKGSGTRKINLAPHPALIPAYLINSERYYRAVSSLIDKIFN